MFFAPRKTKTTVFTTCFASGCVLLLVAKTTVFPLFFGQHRAKTLVFAQFSACCKKILSMQKSQNPCKLQCFGSDFRVCDGVEGGVLK